MDWMDRGLRAGVVMLVVAALALGPADRGAAQRPEGGPCDLSVADVGANPVAYRILTVTVAYCDILRRPPDPEGLTYWTRQLADGLSPYELVELFYASPEFLARQAKSFWESLTSLQLGPTREAERARAAQAAREEAQQDQVEPEAEAGLRVRSEISAADFDRFVARLGLDDLELITPALAHGRHGVDGQRVNVAVVHLSSTRGVRVSPGDRRRARVGAWAEEIGAHVAINGNWYGPFDGPAVSGGLAYGGADHFYTALFGFTAEGDAIIEHHREVNDGVDPRVVEGVSGHPTLVHRGERTTDFGNDPTFSARHPRTAIGLDASGDILLLVTVDGRSRSAAGMTGDETARLLERLGAFDAVMLDGGGSTTMWLAGRGVVNQPSGGTRAVGNQLAVFGD